MPYFLIQATYTAEAWAALLQKPQDRAEAIRGPIEALGGRLEHVWLSFGESDLVVVMQMPDNVSAAAMALAVSAGGALKAYKTTPLLTVQEGMEAMRKAAGSSYRAVTRNA